MVQTRLFVFFLNTTFIHKFERFLTSSQNFLTGSKMIPMLCYGFMLYILPFDPMTLITYSAYELLTDMMRRGIKKILNTNMVF